MPNGRFLSPECWSHQRNLLHCPILSSRMSIAFGAHDTRLGSQRELRKRVLFPGLLLDDRNSQTVTFESDKPRISLDHKSGQEVPLPLFIHPSA
jgi:hypothetical protein